MEKEDDINAILYVNLMFTPIPQYYGFHCKKLIKVLFKKGYYGSKNSYQVCTGAYKEPCLSGGDKGLKLF